MPQGNQSLLKPVTWINTLAVFVRMWSLPPYYHLPLDDTQATLAAGVITDIGGPLSHGSIVAREYGIPAIMGTGVATRRIHSGQIITMDGGAGVITLSRRDA